MGIVEGMEAELDSGWKAAELGGELKEKGGERVAHVLGKVGKVQKRLVSAIHGRGMVLRSADKGGGVCVFSRGIEDVMRREHIKEEGVYMELEDWVQGRLGEPKTFRLQGGREVQSTLSFKVPGMGGPGGKGEWSRETSIDLVIRRIETFLTKVLPDKQVQVQGQEQGGMKKLGHLERRWLGDVCMGTMECEGRLEGTTGVGGRG